MNFATCERWAPQMLSIFRIMAGLLYLQHGTIKWLGIPPGSPMSGSGTLATMSGVGGVVELICGILLVIGLFSRPAAFIAAGETAVIYFYAHYPLFNPGAKSFFPLLNGGELAALFCFSFLYILFAGPGPWSLDAKMRKQA